MYEYILQITEEYHWLEKLKQISFRKLIEDNEFYNLIVHNNVANSSYAQSVGPNLSS